MNESSIERHSLVHERCLTCGALLPCALHDREMKRGMLNPEDKMPNYEMVWEKGNVFYKIFIMKNGLVYQNEGKLCVINDINNPESVKEMAIEYVDGQELNGLDHLSRIDERHLIMGKFVLELSPDELSFTAQKIKFEHETSSEFSFLYRLDVGRYVGHLLILEGLDDIKANERIIATKEDYFAELRKDAALQVWEVRKMLQIRRNIIGLFPIGGDAFLMAYFSGPNNSLIKGILINPKSDENAYLHGIGGRRSIEIGANPGFTSIGISAMSLSENCVAFAQGHNIWIWIIDKDNQVVNTSVAFKCDEGVTASAPAKDGGFIIGDEKGDVWHWKQNDVGVWERNFVLQCDDKIFGIQQLSNSELLVGLPFNKNQYWRIPEDKLTAYHERRAAQRKPPPLPSNI